MSRSALTRQSMQKSLAMRSQQNSGLGHGDDADEHSRRVKQDELPMCVSTSMVFSFAIRCMLFLLWILRSVGYPNQRWVEPPSPSLSLWLTIAWMEEKRGLKMTHRARISFFV